MAKNIKNAIFSVLLLLTAMFTASSCSSFIETEEKQDSGAEKVKCVSVHFTFDNESDKKSRAISNYYKAPEDLNAGYFDRIVFTGTLLNAPSDIPEENKSFTFDEVETDGKGPSQILDATEFKLYPGRWKVNFKGFKDISKNYSSDILQQMNLDSPIVLLASCEDEIEISESSGTIHLSLVENDELKGGIIFSLKFPTSGYAKITTEAAKLSDSIIPGTETEISADELQDGQVNFRGAFASGLWILRIRFYSDADRTVLQCIRTVAFRSGPGRVLFAEFDFSGENINSTTYPLAEGAVFVSANASAGGDGSLEKPFATLKEAINSFTEKTATNTDGSIKNTIYLLSDFTITNAMLDGVENSDLFVRIEGLKDGKAENVEKVKFTCNINQTGTDRNTISALWLSGTSDQRFHFKNIDFTSTAETSSYGLMGVGQTSQLTLENCTVKNIKTTRNVSAIYNEGTLLLKNVEITGNIAKAEENDTWTSAVDIKNGSLAIDGAVKIYGNTCSTEGGTDGNLYIGIWNEQQHERTFFPIRVLGDISGSKIYFTPVGYPVPVTDGYSTNSNVVPPSNYFVCEEGWEVTWNENNTEAFVDDEILAAYVSNSGSDETGTGSESNPFATINHAVEKITGQRKFDSQKLYEIKLMSDLVADDETDFVKRTSNYNGTDYEDYSFVSIASKNSQQLKLKISPVDSQSNVEISVADGLVGRVLYAGEQVELSLKNISISGGAGYAEEGAGIYSKASKLILENCYVYDNTTNSFGGAVYIAGGNVTLKNCTIGKNPAGDEKKNQAYDHGGIFVDNNVQLTLTGKNYIQGNYNTDAGKIENIYLPDGKTISIDGDISGSKIGITTARIPSQYSPVQFVNNATDVSAYAGCFVSDNADYYVKADANSLQLAFIPFDVLTSNGNFKKFSALSATDEAVGIRFYQKNTFPAGETAQHLSSFIPASSDANIQKIDSIVIGLNHSDGLKWQTSANEGVGGCIRFADLEGAANSTGTGLDSWKIICEVANSSFTADPEANFPAFAYILNYRNTEAKYENGWYMPSANELTLIYENKNLINLCLQKVGGSQLSDSIYWTSTTRNDDSQTFDSLALDFNDGLWTSEMNRYLNSHNVIPILALDSEGKVIGEEPAGSGGTGDVSIGDLSSSNPPVSGTTYSIATAEELKKLSELSVDNNFSGCNLVLTDNIDLGNVEFKPIGKSKQFAGNFDGNGYEITGLKISDTTENCALFAKVGGVKISNVIVEGSVQGSSNCAGIVGSCSVTGTTIENCVSKVTVSSSSSTTGTGFAGIIGSVSNKVYIKNCINLGNISGAQCVAGIIGSSTSGTEVLNCANLGKISKTSTGAIGGLVGNLASGTIIKNSYNGGTVNGDMGYIDGSNSGSGTYQNVYWLGNSETQRPFSECKLDSFTGSGIACFSKDSDGITQLKTSLNQWIASNADASVDFAEWNYTITLNSVTYPVCIDAGTYIPPVVGLSEMGGAPGQPGTYYVTSIADLKTLSEWVNAGNVASNDYIFELTGEFDLSGETLTPVGSSTSPFKATFDGKDKIIENLTLTASSQNSGLFGVIDGGTVKNLTLDNVSVNSSYNYFGAFCGQMKSGSIENCHTTNALSKIESNSVSYCGGIVGYVTGGNVVNCSNSATVTGTQFIGGIVGYYYPSSKKGTIDGCTNKGDVTGGQNVGGITGRLYGNEIIVKNCANEGNVTGTNSSNNFVGGIAGQSNALYVYNSSNSGTVTATGHYVGGICGHIDGSSGVYNQLKNTGTVSAGGEIGGGIAGYMSNGHILNSYNIGKVTSSKSVAGGIAGQIYNSAAKIMNCYNLGTISSLSKIGGICGSNSGSILNCYSVAQLVKAADTTESTCGIISYSLTTTAAVYNSYGMSKNGISTLLSLSDSETSKLFNFGTIYNSGEGSDDSFMDDYSTVRNSPSNLYKTDLTSVSGTYSSNLAELLNQWTSLNSEGISVSGLEENVKFNQWKTGSDGKVVFNDF